jgi:hypothetical protein
MADASNKPVLARVLIFAGTCMAAATLTACSTADDEQCDRECLLRLSDDYVAALVRHDPKAIKFTDDARFVENLKPAQPGEGLWADASGGATNFVLHVPDPEQQSVGWLGMMERKGEPALVAIRLKLENGKIAEAEHLVTSVRPENAARLVTPRSGLLSEVPEGARTPHDELIRIGASYYDALDDNDGTKMPFAADCERHENGMITAGANAGAGPNNAGSAPIARDCAGQLSSNVMAYITSIDDRRVFAADPVTGLVMGFSHFRHPMDFAPYEVTALDGSKLTYGKDRFPFEPFDLSAAHIFKIGADGKVHEIEAMGFMAPYNSPTGWGAGPPVQ